MKDNYIKFRIKYDNDMFLCRNRRLTHHEDRAAVFSSADDALRFASFDIKFGKAEIFKYVPVCVRCLVPVEERK